MPASGMSAAEANLRAILRIVLVIVGVVVSLYVLYLLRKPIGWIVLATFIAVAMSAPVNLLARHMHRGLAIALSYLGLLAVPVLLALILIPPIVNGVDDLAGKAPQYAADAQDYVQKNDTLRKLEDDYGVISQVQEQAKKLPGKIGNAAGLLKDLGVGVVNSVFAGLTILILSIFMVADGRRWILRALAFQPLERRERLDRALSRISTA